MKTEITKLLGITYPILQGGMAWVAEYHLAAAVSEAGGFGIIGAASAPPEAVREQIRKVKERTDRPFGGNVMLMNPTAPDVAPEQAEIPEGGSAWLIKTEETAVQYRRLSAQTVLASLWLAGSGAAAVFLLAVNGRFWLRLRRTRQSWPVKGCSLPG